MGKKLYFSEDDGTDDDKRWLVFKIKNDHIGTYMGDVFYDSEFGKYIFSSGRSHTTYPAWCLRQIADFMDRKNRQQRR